MKTKFVQQKQIAQRKLNSCKSIFLLAFMLINCALIAQQSNICVDAVLDFSNPGYHWEHNATYGNFEVEDQHFEIKIKDGDGILQDVKEAGAGIMVGTEPHSVYDNVSIIYQLSESTSNVQFSIRDLDYKNYGHGSSNQQEAVCIFGYCGDTEVMPVITSLDGSVHISGNCAEATTDSRHGHDESIQVTFNQCVDKIKIKYGTGSNSPVHNPTYGKIFIGEVGGVTASTCNSTCNGCDDHFAGYI